MVVEYSGESGSGGAVSAPARRVTIPHGVWGGLALACISCTQHSYRAPESEVTDQAEVTPGQEADVTNQEAEVTTSVPIATTALPPPSDAPHREPGADTSADVGQVGATIATYRATQRAYNRGDTRAYARGYAPRMECWQGRRDVAFTREPDDGQLVHVHHIQIVSHADGDVIFIDFGAFGASYLGVSTHRKLVRMRRREGRWLIVAEEPLDDPRCMASPPDPVTPPSSFLRCRAAHRACILEVDRDYPPDEDATNGWDARMEECNCTLLRCLGGEPSSIEYGWGCDI